MMKKGLNKRILFIMIMVITILAIPVNSKAGLQANKNGTSLVNTTASDFFSLIKGMETGTLGKNTVNASDGLDCHMIKNTEWGGIAILAACSSYGTKPANNTNNSTTGNESGIYQMAGGQGEYTAHYITGTTQAFASNITNATEKYKNVYASNSTRIAGDALSLDTISYSSSWTKTFPVLIRGLHNLFVSIAPGNGAGEYSDGRLA